MSVIERAVEAVNTEGWCVPQPEGSEIAKLARDNGPLSKHYVSLEVIAHLAAELKAARKALKEAELRERHLEELVNPDGYLR